MARRWRVALSLHEGQSVFKSWRYKGTGGQMIRYCIVALLDLNTPIYPSWMLLGAELWCAFAGFAIGWVLARRKYRKESK
jgi:hypothetical protein